MEERAINYKVNPWIQSKHALIDISEAAKGIFEQLLKTGISFDKVVKVRGTLYNLKEAFAEYNAVYATTFSGRQLPARVTYGKRLPDAEAIRIQCITSDAPKKIIETKEAPAAVGPYSQAVVAGNTLFMSGQIPIDPATGKLAGNNIHTQTKQALRNVKAILQAANFTEDHVFEVVVFTTSTENAESALLEIKSHYLNANIIDEPADELPAGSLVEIEVTARKV